MTKQSTPQVLVHGASGHTGRFVIAELLQRGVRPVLAGRNADRLHAAAREVGEAAAELPCRTVDLADAASLAEALADIDVVVNCAGPFLDTALPLATAAVAAGAHYVDVTAEQPAVQALYDALDAPAKAAGVSVIPALAFYGGLADLLVTDAIGGGEARGAEVTVAIGLDHWWPTAGTRRTGERNTATRQVIRDGRLVPLAADAEATRWDFADVLGDQAVVEVPFSEVITIHRHLPVDRLTSYLTAAPLAEIRDPETAAPTSIDESGRSAQRFVVEAVVRTATGERRSAVSGRDIYAITAPIVVEGVARLLDGRHHGAGALAPGSAFDAADMLGALAAHPAGVTRAADAVLN